MLHTARLIIVHLFVSILLLWCMPLPGSSRDAKGNYVALGFGSESCQTFLHARSNRLDLPYRDWLTGYLTAVNKLTKETVDIRSTTDIAGMLGFLDQCCKGGVILYTVGLLKFCPVGGPLCSATYLNALSKRARSR
jgi:hypothetical protein